MKRVRGPEDDDDIPESSRVREVQHRSDGVMDDPVLECKHRIFLSHSGYQKDFVEILCEDLENFGRFPFFDRRPSSLPKGESWPEKILTAARQCQIGVVVVSEEYFMSKWPMIELDAFVQTWLKQEEQQSETKLKILPLFYELSLAEFEMEERRAAWYSKWEDLAKEDKRIDISSWKDSLRQLKRFNGIVRTTGLKAFRDEFVKQICNDIPADVKWDDSHVQGGSKLCQVIQEAISGIQPSEQYGVRVVGVYGVGGMGKTTLCKILCNKFCEESHVKSSHVELGIHKSSGKLLKEVLKDLTNTDQVYVKGLNEGKCWNLLKTSCKRRIFLAIDNVWPDSKSLEEAKKYLKLGFHKDSVVIVTSRALDTLTSLGVSRQDCFGMPSLEEEDAQNLFLYHATSGNQILNDNDKQAIRECIRLCYFSKGKHWNDCHYLPLALKALGLQLGNRFGKRPSEWVKALHEVRNFDSLQDEENPVFSILRSSFDSLKPAEQNLFMDLVIFSPSYHYSDMSGDEVPLCIGLMEWLVVVHNESLEKIGNRVQRLKERGLVEDVDMGAQKVYLHDLYREFAKLEGSGKLKDLDFEERKWAYYHNSYPTEILEMMPSRGRWQNLTRVGVVNDLEGEALPSLEGIEWTNLSNVVVLKLCDFIVEHIGDLDLKHLRCLKSLELLEFYPRSSLDGLQDLKHLVYFKWELGDCVSCEVFLGKLPASLKVLILLGDKISLGSGVFDLCSNLAKVELRYCGAKNLDFRNCPSLQHIELYHVREGVSELCLDGLEDLSKLTVFRWKYFDGHEDNWEELKAELEGKSDHRLQCQLPASLQVLEIVEKVSLRSDVFARCSQLRRIYLRFCRAESLDLRNCTSLKSLEIYDLDQRVEVAVTEASLERLDDHTDFNNDNGNSIIFPASLQILRAWNVRFPLGSVAFDLCVNLTKLELGNCDAGNLDFRNCSSLETLELWGLHRLYSEGVSEVSLDGLEDLSKLTVFRWLYCYGHDDTWEEFKAEQPDGVAWHLEELMEGKSDHRLQCQLPASLQELEIVEKVSLRSDVFARCSQLRSIYLRFCRAESLDLRNCTSLKRFEIDDLDQRVEVAVTEASLERLDDLTDLNRADGNSIKVPASPNVLQSRMSGCRLRLTWPR